MHFDGYSTEGFYDEMFESNGVPRPSARLLYERIKSIGDAELRRYQQAAEQALFRMGITFNVYGDQAGTEKIFPFDILPRIVPCEEWKQILSQSLCRIKAAARCMVSHYGHRSCTRWRRQILRS